MKLSDALEMVRNSRCDNCAYKDKCKHDLPVLDEKCRDGIYQLLGEKA